MREVDFARDLNERKRTEALTAAQASLETEVADSNLRAERLRENEQLIRDMEREQKVMFDQEDLEYLSETLRTQEEMERAAREREIQAAIDQHAQLVAEEQKYGATVFAIRQALASAEVGMARNLIGTLAAVAKAGGKKMEGIAKAAAIAQLGIDLATKPFEAYAKTSAAYPFPYGPILGALHAGLVVAQIGIGMANVGGSGGGGGAGGASGGHTVTSGNVVSPLDEELRRERESQVIQLTVELDGRTLAQVVQEHLAYAENE